MMVEITGAGVLECTACGEQLHFHETATIAARVAHDHPLMLNLDINVVRGMLGDWIAANPDVWHEDIGED